MISLSYEDNKTVSQKISQAKANSCSVHSQSAVALPEEAVELPSWENPVFYTPWHVSNSRSFSNAGNPAKQSLAEAFSCYRGCVSVVTGTGDGTSALA